MRQRALLCLVATSTYSLLTGVFVALRLAGVVDWPWVWVFSPLWLPLAVVGAVTSIQLLWAYVD